MAQPEIFESRQFLRPGAYSKFKLQPAGNVPVDVSTMLLIGASDGGIPYNASAVDATQNVMLFTSISDARSILRSGDLLNGCSVAFNPSTDPNISGASRVLCIRSQSATKSSVQVKSAGVDSIVVSSADYGLHTNGLAIQISQVTHPQYSTVVGANIILSKDGDSLDSGPLYNPLFSIAYPSGGPATSMNVSYVSATDTLIVNDGSTDIINTQLSHYPTVQDLADYIMSVEPLITVLPINNSAIPSRMDDITSPVDIKGTSYVVTANYWIQLDWLNRIATLTTAAQTGSMRKTLDAVVKTYFTGGSTSSPLVSDYINAISLAEKMQAFYQIELSGSINVAQVNMRSVALSNDVKNRRERIGGSGALTSDTHFVRMQNSTSLNSMFYVYGASPVAYVDNSGNLITLDPKFLPVYACAINSGNGPSTPATFKALNCSGIIEKYTSDQIDNFLSSGCLIVDTNELSGSPQITRSVTTYRGLNLIASEMSMVATALALVKDFRMNLENLYISATTTTGIDALINASAKKLLDGYVTKGWLTNVAGPAYQNLTTVIVGDAVYINKDATLVAPINFIFDLFNLSAPGL